jgi:hypothetical protein
VLASQRGQSSALRAQPRPGIPGLRWESFGPYRAVSNTIQVAGDRRRAGLSNPARARIRLLLSATRHDLTGQWADKKPQRRWVTATDQGSAGPSKSARLPSAIAESSTPATRQGPAKGGGLDKGLRYTGPVGPMPLPQQCASSSGRRQQLASAWRLALPTCAATAFACLTSCSHPTSSSATRDVPFGDWCYVEDYVSERDGQLGASGIDGIVVGNRLDVAATLVPRDVNKGQGEVICDIDHIGDGPFHNLAGSTLQLRVQVPRSFCPVKDRAPGIQVILESESTDGFVGRAYSKWRNLEPGAATISWQPADDFYGHKDPPFDLRRVLSIGIKLAVNTESPEISRGTVSVRSLTVAPASSIELDRRTAILAEDDRKNARQWTSVLAPSPASSPSSRDATPTLGAVTPRTTTPCAESIAKSADAATTWETSGCFKRTGFCGPGGAIAVAFDLPAQTDLRGRKAVISFAVAPSLRGSMARPNLAQIGLVDAAGRTAWGPSHDVSADSILFDRAWKPLSSEWRVVEVAPDPGTPIPLGEIDPEFRADQVSRIEFKLTLGKHAERLYPHVFPVCGAIRFASPDIQTASPGEPPPRAFSAGAGARVSGDATSVVDVRRFAVGINGAWHHYGWDFGRNPYGGRSRCGWSAAKWRLRHDFARFKAYGIRLVRQFVLADLRAGVQWREGELPAGVDACVAEDLKAFLETAAEYRIAVIPVLLDFKVADGVLKRCVAERCWREGEAPNLIRDRRTRKVFLEQVVRPIAALLEHHERTNPGLIYAIDLFNEPENAKVNADGGFFRLLREFALDVAEVFQVTSPGIRLTIGSRSRADLDRHWRLEALDLLQFHVYDNATKRHPLSLPSVELDAVRPVLIGELEPTNIAEKLDTLLRAGYVGALFWSNYGRDGYEVDLDQILSWHKNHGVDPNLLDGFVH